MYEYQSVGNQHDPPVYWYYKSMKEGETWYLLGMSYDPEFSPDQFIREERVGNGMLLVDFFTYEKDSTGKKQQVQAKIEAANVFPFEIKQPPGVLLTSFHWQTLADSSTITMVRNRQFDGDTAVVFREKKLPAIKFHVLEMVDQEQEGHLELEYRAAEIYAENTGLVYFEKNITDGWRMAYRLADIYDMAAFEEKFKTKLEGNNNGKIPSQ